MNTIELVAQCLCKTHTFTTHIPPSPPGLPGEQSSPSNPSNDDTAGTKSPLPLEAMYCHCTSCRRSTGAMYSVSVVWPGSLTADDHQKEQLQLASLRRYKRSPESPATGLFCSICSSLMFYELALPASSTSEHGDTSDLDTTQGNEDKAPENDNGKEEEKGKAKGKIIHGVFLGCLRAYNLDDQGNRIGPVTSGLVKPGHHLFLGDTVDGGAVCWMKGWGSDQVKLWTGHRNTSDEIKIKPGKVFSPLLHATTSATQPPSRREEEVQAKGGKRDEEEEEEEEYPEQIAIKCHCEGVNLLLQTGPSRREYLSKIQQGKTDELPWFVNSTNGKPIGTLDGCDSCTTWSGVDLFNWTFGEIKYLDFASQSLSPSGSGSSSPSSSRLEFPADTAQLKIAVEENMRRLSLNSKPETHTQPEMEMEMGTTKWKHSEPHPLGTLSYYASSPDVQRYFCARCSASIFYAVDDRPQMVDIAVGVLGASSPPDGARAERIISWDLKGAADGKVRVHRREDMLACWRADIVHGVEGAAEAWMATIPGDIICNNRGVPQRGR